MSETPNIHLGYSDDDATNRNWEILDRTIRALSRQVIPEGLTVQGNLEVTGNALIDGTLTASGQTTLGVLNVSNTATFLSAVGMNGALVVPNGPVTLPPGSIAPAALASGAATTGVWIGTAQTTQLAVTTSTPVELANAATDANEDPARWSLVIAQATLEIQFGASGSSPNGTVTLLIRRGATDVQSRTFIYDASQAPGDGLDLQIPYTLVRLAKPGDATNIWRLMATLTQIGGGVLIGCTRTFAQVHVVQFR